jgi:hypothetical protein
MDPWMTKKGYPVLTIKKADVKKYIVTQEHFLYDKTAALQDTL